MQHIHISNIDNIPSVCFDTGLDPRSFARTKMSQSLIEQGFVVRPDGSHETWRSAGVNEVNGFMRVWGPLFAGKRFDRLIEDAKAETRQTALSAAVFWIRAKMFLGDKRSSLNPGATFICFESAENPSYPKGSVFFAPEHLSNRCLFMEGSETDRYNCPDLLGMEAAAFCAGVMLYTILTGNHPYPSGDIYQDMREGVYLPIALAVPELDKKLSELIQAALLLPVEKKRTPKSGTDILSEMLEILMSKEGKITAVDSLFHELPAEEKKQSEKERKIFLLKQNVVVKTRRFAVRNKYALMVAGVIAAFVLIIVFSTVRNFNQRWTTQGLSPEQVIIVYYDAYSSLEHMRMESCIQGADRTDINVAASFYAVSKAREAYEMTNVRSFIPARVWKDTGGELPAPNVFGVTDLSIKAVGGSDVEITVYRADYLLWSPTEDYALNRSDILMLRRDNKRNWRIIEIQRTEW